MNARTLLPALVLLAGLVTLPACDVLSTNDAADASASTNPLGILDPCGDTRTVDLVSTGGRVRGVVDVFNDDAYLYVRLSAPRPIDRLTFTALYVGTTPPTPGDVDPATMTHRVSHPGGTSSYTYQLPLPAAPGTPLYVAAFGRRVGGGPHWGDGAFVEGTHARYFSHVVQACAGGGDEGCGTGFWKNRPDAWAPTGFTPDQVLGSVFEGLDPALEGETLMAALGFQGGPDPVGAQEILLRQAVAALLNAAHPGVDFPRTPGEITADVNAALASGDRPTILALAEELDADNGLGCPFS